MWCIRKKIHPEGIRQGRRSGFTLLEVLLSLSLLVSGILGLLYTTMGVVRMNKLNELEVAGSNAISAQLETLVAFSRDNASWAGNVAKGAVAYLMDLSNGLPIGGGPNPYPIRVSVDQAEGIVTYEFAVPPPGESLSGLVTVDGSQLNDSDPGLRSTAYNLGKGVMRVYLRENNVPEVFRSWWDVSYVSGGPDVETPSEQNYFSMDDDTEPNGDFLNLMQTSSPSVYAGSKLQRLPVQVEIRYYNSPAAMEADRPTDGSPGFRAGSDSSAVAFGRNVIVNA